MIRRWRTADREAAGGERDRVRADRRLQRRRLRDRDHAAGPQPRDREGPDRRADRQRALGPARSLPRLRDQLRRDRPVLARPPPLLLRSRGLRRAPDRAQSRLPRLHRPHPLQQRAARRVRGKTTAVVFYSVNLAIVVLLGLLMSADARAPRPDQDRRPHPSRKPDPQRLHRRHLPALDSARLRRAALAPYLWLVLFVDPRVAPGGRGSAADDEGDRPARLRAGDRPAAVDDYALAAVGADRAAPARGPLRALAVRLAFQAARTSCRCAVGTSRCGAGDPVARVRRSRPAARRRATRTRGAASRMRGNLPAGPPPRPSSCGISPQTGHSGSGTTGSRLTSIVRRS